MKIIKDLVHGYVDINELEEKIIDTIHFQRLKDIKQLTAQYAFPSATHTRFEHSLGVMYLSKKAFQSLKNSLFNDYKIEKIEYNKLYFHLTIASLLHDIGHAPYSHLGELYYREDEIKFELRKTIKRRNLNIDCKIFSKGSKHELMSCFVILEKYVEIINKSSDNIDYELICRCIVGNTYENSAKWKENLIIQIINSNTIDADRLDYLMRDAYMTSINVPSLDISRLYSAILIHPITKKVTFSSKALPVIQNIIDARDSLYLWVYNHHTAVYTDFVTEFYLIANFETNNRFKDKLNPNDYFSCSSIINGLISDSDLNVKLNEPISYLDTDNVSRYTKNIIPQLMERKFLKPLWKTIYDYNIFLKENIPDDTLREELTNKLCENDYVYRRYIVKEIITDCNLKLGDVFIVPRSNKFYSLNAKNVFSVFLNGADTNVDKLLPQRDYKHLFSNVAFYVFGKEDSLVNIKNSFIKIINKALPHKDELQEDATNLEWFKWKE